MNLLHNMSAPPRTSFTLGGQTVAGHARVVCFVWALAHRAKHASHPGRTTTARRNSPKTGTGWNWESDGIPGIGHDLPSTLLKLGWRLRELFQTPAELFAKIGRPVAPAWRADFLIGYRLRYADLEFNKGGPVNPTPSGEIHQLHPVLCTDPLLCAGILSRCAGPLFLSRRTPVLSWHTLLDVPIAFDDPLALIP